MKKLKRQTPDYLECICKIIDKQNIRIKDQIGFKQGDIIYIDTVSLVNKTELTGNYIFDSYDTSDNTAYVSQHETRSFTYNIPLGEIEKVYTWRDTLNLVSQ